MYEIYSKVDCTFCRQAKQLLDMRGLEYKDFMLGVHFTRDELLERFPDAKTFPQITLDGVYIGGFDKLKKHLKIT